MSALQTDKVDRYKIHLGSWQDFAQHCFVLTFKPRRLGSEMARKILLGGKMSRKKPCCFLTIGKNALPCNFMLAMQVNSKMQRGDLHM